MTRSVEIAHYRQMRQQKCNRFAGSCPGPRKNACKAISRLIGRLKRGDADLIADAKDEVRDRMKALDYCRVASGERLSLYGVRAKRRK